MVTWSLQREAGSGEGVEGVMAGVSPDVAPGLTLAAICLFFQVCPELGCRLLHGCPALWVCFSICQSRCPWVGGPVSSSTLSWACAWRGALVLGAGPGDGPLGG